MVSPGLGAATPASAGQVWAQNLLDCPSLPSAVSLLHSAVVGDSPSSLSGPLSQKGWGFATEVWLPEELQRGLLSDGKSEKEDAHPWRPLLPASPPSRSRPASFRSPSVACGLKSNRWLKFYVFVAGGLTPSGLSVHNREWAIHLFLFSNIWLLLTFML